MNFFDSGVYLNIILPFVTYARPVMEIFLLFLIIYILLYSLRGTRESNMLLGLVMVLVVFTSLVRALNFEVLAWLMDSIWVAVPTLLIVIFQPELRKAFARIGSNPFSQGLKKREVIAEVVTAVEDMSQSKTGALIVFEGKIGMRSLINDSIKLDSRISAPIIESIFYPNSPLHDGAIIIQNDRIAAARVILPLSRDENLSRTMGTRHRAALGITEENDSVVIIVSEENGFISVAYQGVIQRGLSVQNLEKRLEELLLKQNSTTATMLGLHNSPASGAPEEEDKND